MSEPHKARVRNVGELESWLRARKRDGSLTRKSPLFIPDMDGCGAGREADVQVTFDGTGSEEKTDPKKGNGLQMWGNGPWE